MQECCTMFASFEQALTIYPYGAPRANTSIPFILETHLERITTVANFLSGQIGRFWVRFREILRFGGNIEVWGVVT